MAVPDALKAKRKLLLFENRDSDESHRNSTGFLHAIASTKHASVAPMQRGLRFPVGRTALRFPAHLPVPDSKEGHSFPPISTIFPNYSSPLC